MSRSLIIVGAAFQISGFGLALYQSLSTRRRVVPEAPSLFVATGHRIAEAAHSGYERSRRVIHRALLAIGLDHLLSYEDEGNITVSGGASTSVEGYAIRKSKPLDERVVELEVGLQKASDEIAGLRVHVETRIGQAVGEVEERRKAELRRSLLLEEVGVVMFLVGLGLTTVGAL